jgi:endonuclease G
VTDERELLRESTRRILAADKGLAEKLDTLRGLVNHADMAPTVKVVQERVSVLESTGTDQALALETIVLRVGRPVLEVANDDYLVDGPESTIWETRLSHATVRAALRNVIPAVGRIEVTNHPDLTWIGTGWLIADDVVVTNRHVAGEFATLKMASGGSRSFVFKRGWPDRKVEMAASIDFRRELRNNAPRTFVVKDVLHIEDDDGPDFAFLRVERAGSAGPLSPSLRPATAAASAEQFVATIGYPAADSRIPEQDLMTRLFGDKYNVKRLAPGQVQKLTDGLVMHDCSTLGGNSGSPIIDLTTGEVLGLHFSGIFLKENRGVPIGYVTSRLQKVLTPLASTANAGAVADLGTTPDRVTDSKPSPVSKPENQAAPALSQPRTAVPSTSAAVTFTIPLQISVTLGSPVLGRQS